MEQQYILTLEDFKRMYPNVQVVSVAGGMSDDSQSSTQPILLSQDESLVLNETSLQQLVAYQQPTQNTQTYIIQGADNDTSQQAAVAQSSIFYATDVANEQLIQQQQLQQQQQQQQIQHQQQIQQQQQQIHQQQQQQHINVTHQVHQENTQQNILQKSMGGGQQQSIIQQPMSNPPASHQHVIMQQTPHIVLQQQTTQQHQQPTTNQLVLRPMQSANSLNTSRYVYQPQTRTLVYNTSPQTALQANHQQQPQQHNQQIQQQQQQHHIQHQQVESPQNRVTVMQQQQQPTRQLIVTGQPQMQANLVYQSSQSTQHAQQSHVQHNQQAPLLQQKRGHENISRIVRNARPGNIAAQSQAPRLAPFRGGPRFQSPSSSGSHNASAQAGTTSLNNAENITPQQATNIPKQPNRKAPSARGRGTGPRGPRSGAIRGITPSGHNFGQQQQNTPPSQQGSQGAPQQQTPHQLSQTQQPNQQQQTPQYSQTRTIHYTPNQSQQQTSTRPSIPPLVSTPTISQRVFNAVLGTSSVTSTPKPIVSSSQTPQRLIPTQQPKVQGSSTVSALSQPTQVIAGKYRIPKTTPAATSANANTSTNDLEESIQAIVVTKPNEQTATTQTASTPSETSTQKHFQTTVTTYSTIETADEDKKTMKLTNGRAIPLSEFKRHQQQRQQSQPSQMQPLNKPPPISRPLPSAPARVPISQPPPPIPRNTAQQSVSTDDSKKVIRTPPQNPHIIQPISNNKLQNPTGDTQKSARMLVILSNGEQRLITFTLPRESCTVQELLEQVGVPFTPKTSIQCVPNPGASIDYIVTVGITVQESPTELATAAENSLQLSKQQQESAITPPSNPEPAATTTNEKQSSPSTEVTKEPPAKIIPGYLAVCTQCGYSGADFAKCERCKRMFTEEPKRMATSKLVNQNAKSDDEKTTTPQTAQKKAPGSELLNRAAAKAALAVTAPTLSQLRAGKVMIAAAGRGRGRAQSRAKPAEIEPVILTLSSDDEGDDEKSNKSMKTPVAVSSPPIHKAPLPCEPLITENMPSPKMEREDVANVTNSTDQLYTSFTCKMIRFGTYKYEPKEKVLISSKGIKIVAPSCKNPSDAVVLNIQMREIVKIVAHFSKSLNILFIYTLPTCGIYVRENLEMKAKSPETPYFNPSDRADPYKRIVIQMETIPEEAKSVIRSIYSKGTLEEIQNGEATELLLRSCSKDKLLKQDQGSSIKSDPDNIRQILIYPPGKGGIPINTEDYMCLAIDQYLNDVIIDFYLKYLHTNVFTEEQKLKTHIFSSFFYNRLTTMSTRHRHSEKDVKLTASQKRHARVKSWTKNVNLFEKDFIIIPINEQSHWFLAIICFPRLQGPVTYDTHEPVVNQPTVKKKKPVADRKVSLQIGNTTITPLSKREIDAVCLGDDSLSERDEAEGDESDLASDESDSEAPNGNSSSAVSNPEEQKYRPIKQPLILIFDSLAGASRSRVVATLRDYLTCEYRAKIKEDSAHIFNKFNMPGHCVKVPQQNNFTDCGLYVLQYVEHFFKDPIKDYKLPIKQLVNWFETIIVTRKREEISNLLRELIEKCNPDKLPLPEIAFPTLNGKLLETELTDEQAEFEEEEMDEEGEEEDNRRLKARRKTLQRSVLSVDRGGLPSLDEEEFDCLADIETEGESSPVKRNGEKRTINITPSTTTITLKRPLDAELSKSQDPIVRKTARLNESS